MTTNENKPTQSYRILVVSVMAVGHVNACIGLTRPLLKRGHQVAFLVDESYRNKLQPLGFKEFVFQTDEEDKIKNPGEDLAETFAENGLIGGKSDTLSKLKFMLELLRNSSKFIKKLVDCELTLKNVIEIYKPQLFLVDLGILLPSINMSNIPWINSSSVVPLFHFSDHEDLPPAASGLTVDSDRSEWKPFRDLMKKARENKTVSDEFEKLGYPRYKNDITMPQTMALNVYAFPEEYNFPQISKHPDWFNVEVFNKNPEQKHLDIKDLVPKEFYDDTLDGKFSGKWIYLSMGSMGSVDLDLMARLIQALSKTNHKYIVSKGPRHSEYQLSRNMWGERYLPQIQILPLVDLVITHGGNNTVTETFAQGKPMVILPLFGDQFDNASRLDYTGYGKRIDTNTFTQQELIQAVNDLLADDLLKEKLQKASKRIMETDHHKIFCDKVEQIIKNHSN